ncbi:MAG: hypothetical protein O7G88_06065 [bacterium]|nr:hypothetical protein [bacterium]
MKVILQRLRAQAVLLWGEEDAEQQMVGWRETAEQLALISAHDMAADLEPRFF